MNSKKYRIGFTQGTFDMFHIGHMNIIKNARAKCDHLIVGVNSDLLVQEYKNKTPVICEKDRAEIISNIKGVDEAVITTTLDKIDAWEKYHFDAIFIGDDWKGNKRWEETIHQLSALGVDVVFLPHTPDVSSTKLRSEKHKVVEESS